MRPEHGGAGMGELLCGVVTIEEAVSWNMGGWSRSIRVPACVTSIKVT